MLDKPKVNFWFLITVILGLIGAMDWLDPPVFAVIESVLTGLLATSVKVSPNWKYLSLIL